MRFFSAIEFFSRFLDQTAYESYFQTAETACCQRRHQSRLELPTGTLAADLADKSTGAISESNSQLTKSPRPHLQDDRDQRTRAEEIWQARRPLALCFVCVCPAAGRLPSNGWFWINSPRNSPLVPASHDAADIPLSWNLKGNVKPLIQGMYRCPAGLHPACGDVNCNVMASPNLGA